MENFCAIPKAENNFHPISEHYIVYTAVLGFFTACLALCSYWVNKKRELSQKYEDMTNRIFTRLYDMYDDFEDEIIKIKYREHTGYKAIGALYDKYRIEELKIMHNNDVQALRKLDEEFLSETCDILYPSARKLFSILNWMRSQETYSKALNKFYAKEIFGNINDEKIEEYRKILIDVLDSLIMAQVEFVYGKYRHLTYHLDEHSIQSRHYIGLKYADSLLKYERTIKLITDEEIAKSIWEDIEKRYEEQEKQIPPMYRYILK